MQQYRLALADTELVHSPYSLPHHLFHFEGEIAAECEIAEWTVQEVWRRDNTRRVIRFAFDPERNLGFVLTPGHRRRLRFNGVKPEHIRYVTGLAKRMCRRSAFPNKKHKVKRKWQLRYANHLQPHLRFKKPKSGVYVRIKLVVRPPGSAKPNTFALAFDPEEEQFSMLERFTWKNLGMTRTTKQRVLNGLKKECVKTMQRYLTLDMFESD